MTALLHACRQGHVAAAAALLFAAADIDQVSGDGTSPLMIATINGHFDLAKFLLERGANPRLATAAGATPLYGAINVHWAPHAFYPQPSTAQEKITHLELLAALMKVGADPNVRLKNKLWYTGYNFDQSGENTTGATPFWRAAQSSDVEAMRLLVANGARPDIWSKTVSSRRVPGGRSELRSDEGGENQKNDGKEGVSPKVTKKEQSEKKEGGAADVKAEGKEEKDENMKRNGSEGIRPKTTRKEKEREKVREKESDRKRQIRPPTRVPKSVRLGGPACSALHMASGAGFDGNFHRNAPCGWLPAVQYLVEELGFDVDEPDHKGYTPLHNAAFRGDDEMILYLVAKGADVMAVARSGQTTVDMANGPIQRLQPFPTTIKLLEAMGAKNNHKAVSR